MHTVDIIIPLSVRKTSNTVAFNCFKAVEYVGKNKMRQAIK